MSEIVLQGESLRQALHEYVEVYTAERNFSAKTLENKREFSKRFLRFMGTKPYNLVNCRSYIQLLREKGFSIVENKSKPWTECSILVEIKLIRAFTNYLCKYDYLSADFSKKIEFPKVNKKVCRLITPDNVVRAIIEGTEPTVHSNALHRRINEDARAALHFMLCTGLRVNEICSLRREDINLENNPPSFYVTVKGGDEKEKVLPIGVVEIVEQRKGTGPLFRVNEKHLNLCLKRGCSKLGLQAQTCHDLRRIFATNLNQNGASVGGIRDALNHYNIEVTDRYIQKDITDLARIVNTCHDINRKHLDASEILKYAEQQFRKIKLTLNDNVEAQIISTDSELTMKICKRGVK